jgi:hypothetical protein
MTAGVSDPQGPPDEGGEVMKIPQRDPVKTCGEAITLQDFEDERIIAAARQGPGMTPREARARLPPSCRYFQSRV